MQHLKFKIVINCGPCEEYIEKCLVSVKKQSYKNWEAYVTVDPCGDQTYRRALLSASDDHRMHVQRNTIRRYSMYNIVQAIRWSEAAEEDVIVILDGDDWFADQDALRVIASAYETHDCWITYGSWLSNVAGPSGRFNGCWPAYPEGTQNFRGERFLGTAVRTWKKWLWDHLRDADLRSESGEYVRVSEDQIIMIPLLEMCGTERAQHIPAPIMTYNKLAKYTHADDITAEGTSNGDLIARRVPYARLAGKHSTDRPEVIDSKRIHV